MFKLLSKGTNFLSKFAGYFNEISGSLNFAKAAAVVLFCDLILLKNDSMFKAFSHASLIIFCMALN